MGTKYMWYSKLIKKLSKSHKKELVRKTSYDYMRNEWEKVCPSYLKYFDQ